ncbi:MAG TPA: hypothetical protein VLS93_12720 [Anaeromyxobacteraceae bacterium]|nr:hypothetical protein [Anaeromyxobacteraceae bacterium]
MPDAAPPRASALLGPFVALVALHSIAVGVVLAFLPGWGARFGGFDPITPVFFARQGGVFHIVLGIAYFTEHRRTGGVSLLVFAKACATVFLLAATVAGGVPWAVPASAAGDALMGLAAWRLHRGRAAAAAP